MTPGTPQFLECIELTRGQGTPGASVIWMHGLGADGNDFVPIVDELDLPARPIRFVFPHAPMQPVTINGGYVMRAWYDVVSTDFDRREDENGVRVSQANIDRLIVREVERGVPSQRVVLAGFSQGGAIALFAGLRQPRPLAGIMALSTYMPALGKLAGERATVNQSVPIFHAHGSLDPVIPIVHAVKSRDALQALGYRIEWHEYAMPHSVCPEEIEHIGTWLTQVLG